MLSQLHGSAARTRQRLHQRSRMLIVLYIVIVVGVVYITKGAAAHPDPAGQADARPARVRRPAALPAAQGEPGRRDADHLRLGAVRSSRRCSARSSARSWLQRRLRLRRLLVHRSFYSALIFFFSFFWTSLMFQPNGDGEQPEGVRRLHPRHAPGQAHGGVPRAASCSRITLAGATFLAIIAVLPQVARQQRAATCRTSRHVPGRHRHPDRGGRGARPGRQANSMLVMRALRGPRRAGAGWAAEARRARGPREHARASCCWARRAPARARRRERSPRSARAASHLSTGDLLRAASPPARRPGAAGQGAHGRGPARARRRGLRRALRAPAPGAATRLRARRLPAHRPGRGARPPPRGAAGLPLDGGRGLRRAGRAGCVARLSRVAASAGLRPQLPRGLPAAGTTASATAAAASWSSARRQPDVVRERLAVYHRADAPLVAYYRKPDLLTHAMDGRPRRRAERRARAAGLPGAAAACAR